MEGDIDMHGISGMSNNSRPGAQQFSDTASREQINELIEIGKKFSPAYDTFTNGTSVTVVTRNTH